MKFLLFLILYFSCGEVYSTEKLPAQHEVPAQKVEREEKMAGHDKDPAVASDNQSSATQQPDGLPYKKENAAGDGAITRSYIALLIFIAVMIAGLVYLRKHLGAKFSQGVTGEKIKVLESKRIGRQTFVTLMEVDHKLIIVAESASGIAISPVEPGSERDVAK